ncbi:MAG: arginine--tRNA ligase, partial [bacterium]
MIDFKEKLAQLIDDNYESMEKEEILELIETPPQEDMGDLAIPCFKFARIFRKSPNIIAEEIAKYLSENTLSEKQDTSEQYFEDIKNLGPYVNFFINKKLIARTVIKDVYKKNGQYGSSSLGKGKNVIVEFSSPNIAKPFSIAHIRTTVIGHALRNIYQYLGFNTIA